MAPHRQPKCCPVHKRFTEWTLAPSSNPDEPTPMQQHPHTLSGDPLSIETLPGDVHLDHPPETGHSNSMDVHNPPSHETSEPRTYTVRGLFFCIAERRTKAQGSKYRLLRIQARNTSDRLLRTPAFRSLNNLCSTGSTSSKCSKAVTWGQSASRRIHPPQNPQRISHPAHP